MDRARLLLMVLILLGVTSCASLIVQSDYEAPKDRRFGPERCPVHGDLRVDDVVRMPYRSPSMHPRAWELREKLYPCSFESTNNSYDDPYLVKFCPHCRLAYQQFLDTTDHEGWRDPPWKLKGDREEFLRVYQAQIDEFIAEQRRTLQERHPETQFVDELASSESEAALETDTPVWVE